MMKTNKTTGMATLCKTGVTPEERRRIDRRYAFCRYRQVAIMLLGYALFYVCRLAFSATKKSMIEQGAYTAKEIGYVGSCMLIAYAIGKILTGRRVPVFDKKRTDR